MFCPNCGKQKSGAGLCIDCYLNKNGFSLKKKPVEICDCDKVFFHNQWTDNWVSYLNQFVEKNLVVPPQIERSSVDVSGKREKQNVELEVDFIGEYGGEEFRKDIDFSVPIVKRTCADCKHLSGGYFEAVIQYRGEGDIPIELNRSKIIHIETVRGGLDYYITESSYADAVTNQLRKKGFLIKKTNKIFGQKNGETVYRFYYSIKKPGFSKGDILEFKQNPYAVSEVGENVLLVKLINGAEKLVPLNRLKKSPVLGKKQDQIRVVVTEIKPKETIVMDLSDYNNHRVHGRTQGLKPGDEIKIIKVKDRFYVAID